MFYHTKNTGHAGLHKTIILTDKFKHGIIIMYNFAQNGERFSAKGDIF